MKLAHRHRSATALVVLALTGTLALTACAADTATDTAAGSDKAAAAPAPADAGRAAPGGAAQEGAKGAAPATGKAPGTAAPAAPAAPVVRPHVIRTATVGIETADGQQALATARTAAEGAGGYVGNETTQRGKDGRVTSTLTLRVPGERFDAVLGALEGTGKLLSRKVEAQDVTEKVADVDSRVKSAQASVVRVREMMDKASALSDVVMLESELSRRQSDLESLLAQQTALKDQTSLGTITLQVAEPEPVAEPEKKKKKKEDPGFLDTLAGGAGVLLTVLKWALLVLGAVLPFTLAAGLLWLLWRAVRSLLPERPKPRQARPVPAWPHQRTVPGPGSRPHDGADDLDDDPDEDGTDDGSTTGPAGGQPGGRG
ncbi:DUF4349 domain-containing protein [Streptomyces sp. NPDC090022]|uniref:DUF4349 domain-containing protein n=1 Tax=Streptomyces sp. NPDC090022 TaxID=3365920 RepID=UPI00382BAE97